MPSVRNATFIVIGVLAVILLVAFLNRTFLFRTAFLLPGVRTVVVKYSADQVIRTCAHSSYQTLCFDKEIPKLMDQGISMENSFLVTAEVIRRVPEYSYCHVLAHVLAGKEVAKDPSKWVSVSARCPVDMCAYGCFHGVVESRFASTELLESQVSDLLPNLLQVCRSNKSGPYTRLTENICEHGLGHLFMFAAGGNIRRALGICDSLTDLAQTTDATTDVKKYCYEGSFMQVFQSLSGEERALVESYAPKDAKSADAFCAAFPAEQQAVCHRESWPLVVDTLNSASGISAFCENSSNPWFVAQCYNMVIHVTTSRLNYDEKKITSLCKEFPVNRKAQCFAHAAGTFVYTDTRLYKRALGLCAIANEHGVGPRCYGELLFFSTHAYHIDTQAFRTYCSAFPPVWKERCLAGEGATLTSYVIDA